MCCPEKKQAFCVLPGKMLGAIYQPTKTYKAFYFVIFYGVSLLQITKEKYSHKPTYDNLRQSLDDMKSHCLQNGVTGISMPRFV